ncbi:MAG: biopolymer transporter ExbD [Planctomycetaceae bacterium]|nr:biopolymer transporter ExbD [Planctomycetaceae bacterium]
MTWRTIDQSSAAPDWIPMVDLAFQVVMCLTIISSFEGARTEERVKLGLDSLARPPASKLRDELVLNVGFSSDPLLRQAVVFDRGDEVPLGRIRERLEENLRMFEGPQGRGDMRDVSVIVRAAPEVPTGAIQYLIQTCQDLGFVKFALKSAKPGE